MTRRPAFWVAYAAIALIALGVAWRLFPLAIPIVNLDVTMSRGEALAQAEERAAKRKLAPEGARSAVRSGLLGWGSPSPFSFSGATGFASGRSFDITGALQ